MFHCGGGVLGYPVLSLPVLVLSLRTENSWPSHWSISSVLFKDSSEKSLSGFFLSSVSRPSSTSLVLVLVSLSSFQHLEIILPRLTSHSLAFSHDAFSGLVCVCVLETYCNFQLQLQLSGLEIHQLIVFVQSVELNE